VIGEALLAEHPAGLAQEEQDALIALLALRNGRVRPKALPRLGLSEAQQQATLTLASLLDIAGVLARQGGQDTAIDRVERAPGGWWAVVSGPQAGDAAAAAQASAAAWSKVGYPALRVIEASLAASEMEGFAPLPSPQNSAGLLPGDPLSEAGRKLMLFLFAEMLRHEAGTRLGEDIEALHDMRVATRRLRAAFEVFQSAFEPKALKPYLKGLRLTGRALGRVRDLDVFMEKAQHYLDALPEGERNGLDPLLADWESQRDRARAQMIEHLDGEAFQAFKWSFNQFLNTPGAGARKVDALPPKPVTVREIAPVLLYARLGEVRAFDDALPNAPIELLHALRIQFKKLRYTVEFFREVLGEETRAVINDLKAIQDHLGDLNDADVATGMLKTFLEAWDQTQAGLPVSQRQNPEGIVNYLAARHAERYRLMVSFPEAWEHFNRPEFRRSLALAVSVL
jgi:CHAD domain-containing protein